MEFASWKTAVFLLLQLTWSAAGDTKKRSEVEKEILQNIFVANKFHMYVRPDKNASQVKDEPLEVSVSLFILNIDVDSKKQECNIMMYFRQEWNDSRLAYADLGSQSNISVLSVHDSVGFWTPDLFFVNEKSGYFHSLTKPNTFVRVYPQGKVLYSQRLTVTLACPMDLRRYPFDSQTCNLQVESYGFTANDIILRWKDEVTLGITELSGFHVGYSLTENVIHVGENSYSRLELGIHLSRLIYSQMIHVYIPLGLLVALSWASFWLRPSLQLPRSTAALMMTFATLIFLRSIEGFLYPQPYFTALEIWVGFSSLLIFGSVLESVYVVARESNPDSNDPRTAGILGGTFQNTKDVPELSNCDKDQRKLKDILAGKLPMKDSSVDSVSKMAFPFVFIIFNIIYLACYLL